uniref:Uncharacterized protein n=1 Tax=Panagrolaimus sp. JU765 TaxID=591449 RepID=A0AC34R582_9BILA
MFGLIPALLLCFAVFSSEAALNLLKNLNEKTEVSIKFDDGDDDAIQCDPKCVSFCAKLCNKNPECAFWCLKTCGCSTGKTSTDQEKGELLVDIREEIKISVKYGLEDISRCDPQCVSFCAKSCGKNPDCMFQCLKSCGCSSDATDTDFRNDECVPECKMLCNSSCASDNQCQQQCYAIKCGCLLNIEDKTNSFDFQHQQCCPVCLKKCMNRCPSKRKEKCKKHCTSQCCHDMSEWD